MANNGYLIGQFCSPDQAAALSSKCVYPPGVSVLNWLASTRSDGSLTAFSCGYNNSSGSWVHIKDVSIYSPDCEISGPPLTEIQQIEAINGLFPHAVAILAIAWGLRYIRVLVAEWLKERNASD